MADEEIILGGQHLVGQAFLNDEREELVFDDDIKTKLQTIIDLLEDLPINIDLDELNINTDELELKLDDIIALLTTIRNNADEVEDKLDTIDLTLTNGTAEVKITNGVDTVGISTIGTDKALKVDIVGGTLTGQIDETSFAEGVDEFIPIGGILNDTIASDPTEDQAAAARITPKRAIHTNLRDNDGNELGIDSNPLIVNIEQASPGLSGTILTTDITIGMIASLLPSSVLIDRKTIMVQNKSTSTAIYVGGSGVTTTNGFRIGPRDSWSMDIGSASLYGISTSASIPAVIMEVS